MSQRSQSQPDYREGDLRRIHPYQDLLRPRNNGPPPLVRAPFNLSDDENEEVIDEEIINIDEDLPVMPVLIPRPDFQGLVLQNDENTNMVPTGYMIPPDVVIAYNFPVVGNRSKSRVLAAKQNIISVCIAAASDNYYLLLGSNNPQLQLFFYDLAALLKHKQLNLEFVDLSWKEHLRNIHNSVPYGPYNLPALYTRFQHELLNENMDIIFEKNPELLPGAFQRSQKSILARMGEIIRSHYIFKQFEKLIGNDPEVERIESCVGEFKHAFFLEQQFEEVADCLKSPMFCLLCGRGLSCANGALSHLKSVHPTSLNGNLLEQRRTANTARAIEEATAVLRDHHDRLHPDCNQLF